MISGKYWPDSYLTHACSRVSAAAGLKNTRWLRLAASIRRGAPAYGLVTRRLWDYYKPADILSVMDLVKYDNAKLIFHICGKQPPRDVEDRICAIADKTFAIYVNAGVYLRGLSYSPANSILMMRRRGFNSTILAKTYITDSVIDYILRKFPGNVDVLARIMSESNANVRWRGYERGLVPANNIVECVDKLPAEKMAIFLESNTDIDVPLHTLAPHLEDLFKLTDMTDRVLRSQWMNTMCVKYIVSRLQLMTRSQLEAALAKNTFKAHAIDIYYAMQRHGGKN